MSEVLASRPRPVPPALPPLLSFAAGFIDSFTVLALFGMFVAQVTGSNFLFLFFSLFYSSFFSCLIYKLAANICSFADSFSAGKTFYLFDSLAQQLELN